MARSRGKPWVGASAAPGFPDPRHADARGLVAVGGELTVSRLLDAYARGIFPWYDAGLPPLWWSPDPRAVLDAERLHVSRSLQRRLRRGDLRVTLDVAFTSVMRGCADARAEGTWILPEMVEAYSRLHAAGHAHSFEVWSGDSLVGGLYGVSVGALFAAESMFHRATDASKIALVAAVTTTFAAGCELFDVQFDTPHLSRMGAHAIPRDEYLERLARAGEKRVTLRGRHPHLPA